MFPSARMFVAALLASLAWAAPLFALAESGPVSEQALKAVLFFKLPLFVYRAPVANSGRVGICTLGKTPLDEALNGLPNTLMDGRRVDFRTLRDAADAGDCEFLFIGRSEAGQLDKVLRRLDGRRLVTVSDLEGFAQAGGMVEFAVRGDGSGVQLLINRKAAQRQGVEFNAQLLRLARVVEP